MAIKTILVIEDDRFIGEMYVRSLQHAGYSVDWVVDGHDGLVAATGKPYDLILLDIMLPEMRGPDILKAIRSASGNQVQHTHVIVLTNFDQDTESRIAMQHDVDAYLIKAEITPRKLLEIIATIDTSPTASAT